MFDQTVLWRHAEALCLSAGRCAESSWTLVATEHAMGGLYALANLLLVPDLLLDLLSVPEMSGITAPVSCGAASGSGSCHDI